jgi:hypothetical protein
MSKPNTKRITLSDVERAHPGWFSAENKRLFKDVDYFVLHGEASGKPFLIRSTYAWTDMFGKTPRLHYRVNPLHDSAGNLTICSLIKTEFPDIEAVEEWLATQ